MITWLTGILCGTIGLFCPVAPVTVPMDSFGAFAPISVPAGGTGWGNIVANTFLTGNGTGKLATTSVGSGLTLSGGVLSATGGAGTVSTSTNETSGALAYFTSNSATPALLGKVATTTLTASSPLSLSNPVVKVGGTNSVLTIDTSGAWSGTAALATALAANGANCSAGNYPLGVDASGAVENCTAAAVGGGGIADPFTHVSYAGLTTSATTSALHTTSLLAASSTDFTNASSTLFSAATAWITKLANLATAGFVKTSSDGTLSVDTSTYLTGNQTMTLSGAVTGSGATAITTAFGSTAVANSVLANNTGGAAVPAFLATSSLYTFPWTYALGGTGTTTAPQGQLLYGGATAYQSVATTTLTASAPLSLSNPVVKVGGANSAISLDTSGTWSGNAGTATALAADGADCSAGNFPLGVSTLGAAQSCTDAWTQAENTAAGYGVGSVTSVGTSWPITGGTITTTGTIAWGGLSTSTAAVIGNIPYFSGVNTFANVATSTPTISSPLAYSGTLGSFVGGASGAFSISTAGTWSGLAGTATALAANGANCTAGNYPLGVNAAGAVEDCTAASAGSSAFELATTSDIAIPQLAYFTKTSGLTTLGGIATGTISSANTALTVTGSRSAVGGAAVFTISTTTNTMFSGTAGQALAYTSTGWTGVATTTFSGGLAYLNGNVTNTITAGDGLTRTADDIDCDIASTSVFGCLSTANWDTFNAKESALTFGWPLIRSVNAISFGGVSTSSPIAAASGLLYATGVNTFASISTSSAVNMSITGLAGTATALAADGADCSAGQFPLGVSTLGAAQSCTDAWTEAENTSAAYAAQATTITVAGTANQLTSSAGAQSLAANRTWTMALPTHVIFPSSYVAAMGSTTNATSTNQDITGLLTFNGVTASTWAAFCTTITGGAGLCDGTDATGAGSSAYEIATTTDIAVPQLAYFTKTGGLTTMGSVATGTISATSPLTVTAGRSAIGGAAAFAITANGITDTELAFDTGQTLTTAGTPTFSSLTLTNALSIANGGTGTTTNRYQGLFYGDGYLFRQASTTGLLDFDPTAQVFTTKNASSTNFSALTKASFGSTATSSFNSAGALTLASALTVPNGGSGAATLTGLLQGNGASAFTAIADSSTVGQILRVTGASTYGWGALNLSDTDAITGDLPFANLTQGAANTVLVNQTSATADFAALATSTFANGLYSGSAGQILARLSNGTWAGVATTTFSGGLTFGGGNVTLAALGSAGVLGAVTATVPTVQATSTLYGVAPYGSLLSSTGSGIAWLATSTLFTFSPSFTTTGGVTQNTTYPSFSYATSTTWTGTTTIYLGPSYTSEKWNGIQCNTDAGTLNVDAYYSTTHAALLNASTTIGIFTWTTNNTPSAQTKRAVDIGTPLSSPTKIACTMSRTI